MPRPVNINIALIVFIAVFFVACSDISTPSTANTAKVVRDSVTALMNDIAKDISNNGPTAWLRHFENTPGFFMAADGQLAFANNDSAANFINKTLVKVISKITLRWGGIRIDPLTPTMASVAAVYHEDITNFSAKTAPYDGYFTAIAEQTPQGWKLRNLHWSALEKK